MTPAQSQATSRIEAPIHIGGGPGGPVGGVSTVPWTFLSEIPQLATNEGPRHDGQGCPSYGRFPPRHQRYAIRLRSLVLCRLRLLARRGTQGQAKAQVVVAVRRIVPVAERRPAKRRPAAPTAATVHPARALCIRTPLPHITVHVVQAPAIRQLLTDSVSRPIAVVIKPRVLTKILRIIAKTVRRRCPGAARIFPLRLRR